MKYLHLLFFLFITTTTLSNPIINIDDADLIKEIDQLAETPENPQGLKMTEDIQQNTEQMKIIVVVDSSGSMGEILSKNKSKMYYLKKLMKPFFKERWKEKNLIGLRVYSGLTKNKCDDIRLAVPFSTTKIDQMERVVAELNPLGMTPLHKSLIQAFEDVKDFKGPKRVVVVTDGQDTCGGDPCETAEEWRKQDIDLKFFVIALGLKGDSDSFKKVQCIGDTHSANDDESFGDAMSQISKKINKQDNLQVISPDPSASVYLYKVENGEKKLDRVFYAQSSQTVPPGKYEVVVALKPAFKFSNVQILPVKKTILKVTGDGKVKVNYFNQLVNVEVQDKNNKAIKRFRSDSWASVPTGKWQLRIFKNPFYEQIIPNYLVTPLGEHEYNVTGVGALKVESPDLVGLYAYDQDKKELGQFLSNSTIVLKSGIYTIHQNEKCTFPQIQLKDKKEVIVLSCKK